MRETIFCLFMLTMMAAALKVEGVLDWSWWWVLVPPVAAAVGIAVLIRRM